MSSNRKADLIQALSYLGAALFSLLFMGVYYYNSHGLRDGHMTFLFVPCLIPMVYFFILFILNKRIGTVASMLFNLGFAWLWCYLLLDGIYIMAQVTTSWLWVFLTLGIVMMVLSLPFMIIGIKKNQPTEIAK